jgi:hypothetical protein
VSREVRWDDARAPEAGRFMKFNGTPRITLSPSAHRCPFCQEGMQESKVEEKHVGRISEVLNDKRVRVSEFPEGALLLKCVPCDLQFVIPT